MHTLDPWPILAPAMNQTMQLSTPLPGPLPPVVVEIEAIPPAPLRRAIAINADPLRPAGIAAERTMVVGSWNGGRRYA